jgi:hypothetical protein
MRDLKSAVMYSRRDCVGGRSLEAEGSFISGTCKSGLRNTTCLDLVEIKLIRVNGGIKS